MDVNQDEVVRVMQQHNTTLLIHGHTHRPGVHDVALDSGTVQRVVLGDWGNHGWLVAYHNNNSFELEKFTIF